MGKKIVPMSIIEMSNPSFTSYNEKVLSFLWDISEKQRSFVKPAQSRDEQVKTVVDFQEMAKWLRIFKNISEV